MTPAQRRRRLHTLKSKKNGQKKINKFLLLFLFIVFSFNFFYFFGKKGCFNNLNSTIVFMNDSGDVMVSSFNKKRKEINSILIPANTQLEVSRQLGSWKTKSIWQLGINESYSGKLLQETVIKNFHFPVNMWADNLASGFVSGNFIKLLKATFLPYKSNLSIGDRLNIFLVSLGIQNERVSLLDLSEVGVLKKTRLPDGENGFVVLKDVPISVMSSFSEEIGTEKSLMVQVIDATGVRSIAENVGETIEAMGLKVTSIKEESSQDFDCFVSGDDPIFVKKVSQIYSCQIKKDEHNGFDMIIKLGSQFSKRY